MIDSNEKIEGAIKTIKLRSSAWETQKDQDTEKFKEAIEELEKVDIKQEIEAHKKLSKHTEDSKALVSLQKEKSYHENSFTQADANVDKTKKDIEYAKDAKCPTCEQDLHDDKHTHLVDKLKTILTENEDCWCPATAASPAPSESVEVTPTLVLPDIDFCCFIKRFAK